MAHPDLVLSMTNSTCDVCGKSTAPGAPGGCQGHSDSDLRSALDAIPTPGDKKPGGAPAAAGGAALASQLDSIPTPGAGRSPAPTATPPSGPSLMEQLDSIPTPGAAAGGGGGRPTNDAEVPQWMKNYAAHAPQPGTGGGGGPAPMAVPDPYRPTSTPSGPVGDGTAPAPGGYQMITVILVLVCLAVIGFFMMKGTPPPTFDSTTPTSTTPATTPTNTAPAWTPPATQPAATTPAVPVTPGMPTTTDPNAVPGAVPGAVPSTTPVTTPSATPGFTPGVTPGIPVDGAGTATPYQGNNPPANQPVMPQQ